MRKCFAASSLGDSANFLENELTQLALVRHDSQPKGAEILNLKRNFPSESSVDGRRGYVRCHPQSCLFAPAFYPRSELTPQGKRDMLQRSHQDKRIRRNRDDTLDRFKRICEIDNIRKVDAIQVN